MPKPGDRIVEPLAETFDAAVKKVLRSRPTAKPGEKGAISAPKPARRKARRAASKARADAAPGPAAEPPETRRPEVAERQPENAAAPPKAG